MPRHPTVSEIRLVNVTARLTPAVTLLKELDNAFGPPFIQPISNTIQTLINAVQNVKQNKKECAQLIENIHQILCAIISFHIKSETVRSLSPTMTSHIGEFTETLHKIYTFVEMQQDGNKIKHLFLTYKIQNLLKDCHAGLDQAMEVFLTLSDASTDSGRSSFNFISMLPSKPKIFYGRESEVKNIMTMLSQASSRIAILGGGGMGKTSLAKAVLHHPDTSAKFQHRFFVSAEAATTSIELAALIGLHIGLNPGKDLTRLVVQYFSQKPPSLLILDNLETVWEPIQSRGGIEEFLSLLTEVEHLAFIITMRGAERPAKVHWTRPFLLPLEPVSDDAAQQIFAEITDNVYAKEDLHQILQFTDNMPLALDLMAHLVDYEGLAHVLARWKQKDSLALYAELVQSNLPIPNILSCKATLLGTSLAHQDGNKRLQLLLYQKPFGAQSQAVINQITLNLANLQEVLQRGLYGNASDIKETICTISSLSSFYRHTGRGSTILMDHVQPILPGLADPQPEIYFITEVCKAFNHYPTINREQLISQAITLCEHIHNPFLKSQFYRAAGEHFLNRQLDTPKAMLFFDKALEFSKMCPHNTEQQIVLISIAMLKYRAGEYLTAQAHVAEAQQLLKLAPNLFQEARALWIGAMCSTSIGNFRWSIDQLHRARAVLGICGLERGFMYQTITISQAEIHLVKSEYAQARSIYSQIVESNSPEQNAFSYAISLLNIAQIDTICGDVGDVYHNTSLFPRESIFCSMLTADIELREEKFDLAKHRFQDCLYSIGRTDNEVESFCLDRLADIRAWPISAWQFRWPVIYCAILSLGDVFSTNKEDAVAMNLYLVALQGFTYMDVHHSRAQCMMRLGDLTNKRGHTSTAIEFWKAARPLFERSLQAKDVAQIDAKLSTVEKSSSDNLAGTCNFTCT
ncbi:hypothetical protein B0H14DRAFT_3689461 [Mycena olivaceomarginata]|nr:hypothetical protein B0H14DRAFT_3689461 [Mycena olivaceomarginata]